MIALHKSMQGEDIIEHTNDKCHVFTLQFARESYSWAHQWQVSWFYILGALHTMAAGREAADFHQSYSKIPRVGLSTLHTTAIVQKPLQYNMITFWRRQRTLKGSLGRMEDGIGNPN